MLTSWVTPVYSWVMLKHQFICRLLLMVCSLVFVGHICELSTAEHLVFIHAAAERGEAPHSHEDGQHAESCDATQTSWMPDSFVAVTHLPDLVADIMSSSGSVLFHGVSAVPSSPPLFLLHAALLI